MDTLRERIGDFLAQPRIAVAGVSRTKPGPASLIYRRLKETGHEAYAVNPHGGTFEGDRCYPSLAAIEPPVDGVVVVTRPEVTERIVEECIALGIRRVWMHCLFGTRVKWGKGLAAGTTSVSEAAVRRGEEAGLSIIPGSCPMQHLEPVDGFHRCARGLMSGLGNLA